MQERPTSDPAPRGMMCAWLEVPNSSPPANAPSSARRLAAILAYAACRPATVPPGSREQGGSWAGGSGGGCARPDTPELPAGWCKAAWRDKLMTLERATVKRACALPVMSKLSNLQSVPGLVSMCRAAKLVVRRLVGSGTHGALPCMCHWRHDVRQLQPD